MIHGGNNAFTVELENSFIFVDSSCSDLRIDAWVNVDVTTNCVECNSMGAEWVLRRLLSSGRLKRFGRLEGLLSDFLNWGLGIDDWVVKRALNLRLLERVLQMTLSMNMHIRVDVVRVHSGMQVRVRTVHINVRTVQIDFGTMHVRVHIMTERAWVHIRVRPMHINLGTVHVHVRAVNVNGVRSVHIRVKPMSMQVFGHVHVHVWVRVRAKRSFLSWFGNMFVGALFRIHMLMPVVVSMAQVVLKLVVVVSERSFVDNDIVERVSIIRNQSASFHIASQLNLVRIDVGKRC